MNTWTSEEKVNYNRFERNPESIAIVRKEVQILEDWLDVHPFPQNKHTAKYAIGYLAENKNQKL